MRAHASKTCEHRRHPGQSADRLWPRGASDGFGLDRTSSRSRDLMAFRDQRGNQFTPNGAGRASNKDALHRPQVVGSGGISSTIKRATACAIALSFFRDASISARDRNTHRTLVVTVSPPASPARFRKSRRSSASVSERFAAGGNTFSSSGTSTSCRAAVCKVVTYRAISRTKSTRRRIKTRAPERKSTICRKPLSRA